MVLYNRGELYYCTKDKYWKIQGEDGNIYDDLIFMDIEIKLDNDYFTCAIKQKREGYIYFADTMFLLNKNFIYDVIYIIWEDGLDEMLLAELEE